MKSRIQNRILCVAAHPDDEILGCGASMAQWISEGHAVEVVIAAQGLTSRTATGKEPAPAKELEKLYATCEKANQVLGVRKVHFLDFPDNRMDSMDLLDVVKKIENVFDAFKPNLVLTHFHGDLNIDHEYVHRAVMTAARPQPGQTITDILLFEVPSATDWYPTGGGVFQPNYFQQVDKTIEKKLEALEIYKSEMRDFPHARSIEAVAGLALWRGSSVGVKAAEAFHLVRKVNFSKD